MPRHLLLIGQPGCGKSSCILKSLGPIRRKAGGYRTLRLWREGRRAGFAHIPANSADGVDRPWREEEEGVFLTLGPEYGKKTLHPEVLLQHTLPMLQGDAPFYIVDECGGSELTLPDFYDALIHRLSSPAPVVGVWKGEGGFGSRKELQDPHFRKVWASFRDFLTGSPDIQLVEGSEPDKMEQAVKRWMQENEVGR